MGTIINEVPKTGTITRKNVDSLWISFDPDCPTGSSGCTGGCGSCSGDSKHRKAIISYTGNRNYAVGDKIEIVHRSLNEHLVAFIVFGIPIMLAFLVILAWNIFNPALAESPQSFASAAAALVTGFLIVRKIDKWFRLKYPSEIISFHTLKTENNQTEL